MKLITQREAKELLHVKDNKTINNMVMQGYFRRSKVNSKVILYFEEEILNFINKRANCEL